MGNIISANQNLLTVDRLVVRYGRITAVDDASIHVDRGEIVSIVGPNGAGKSSLLGAIAGLVRPLSGSIVFAETDTVGQPLENTVRRGIALVLEGRHAFAGLTVLENLRLGAAARNDFTEIERDIAEQFETFPILAERRHQAAGRLSGGEQQMLVIARALLSRPQLLMVDEPSLGLAPMMTDRVYEVLARVRKRGVSVLVVEQNAPRALQAADRTYVLNGGRVGLSGPSSELGNHPDFEAAYFGLKRSEVVG